MTSTTVAPAKPPRQVVKDETVTETDDIVDVINEEEEENELEGHEDAADAIEKQDEPKQITVQIEEQSRRPRRDKNLFESKSMTNLKQERLSIKRKHRFSGEKSIMNSHE